jgi:hypothetical protein
MDERRERRERRLDQAAGLLAALLAVALALNGLPFWARRVGLFDPAAHVRDGALFCSPAPPPWWLPATCRPHRLVAPGPPPRFERFSVQRLYSVPPVERSLKLLRHIALPLLLLGSAVLVAARWQPAPDPHALLPLSPLLLSTLLSAWISLPREGSLDTLAAGLGSLWIPLAALAGWLTTPRRWQRLADGAAALVLLQGPVLVLEAMRGLPLPFGGATSPWLPTRLVGLMNQPNSLGGLLALSVALCVSVSRRPWQRWPLLLLALAMALLARAGAGVVALTLLGGGLALGRLPRRGRPLAVVALLLVLALVLPSWLGRPRLYGSPLGRAEGFRVWWTTPRPATERWLGHGLASSLNPRLAVALRHPTRKLPQASLSWVKGRGPSAEGQPLLLAGQGGLVALGAFYGLLAWCAWRDPLLRPFWGVLLLLSFTLNVTEVFPMGIWMAVATARALGLGGMESAAGSIRQSGVRRRFNPAVTRG